MEYIRTDSVNRLELVRGFTISVVPFTEVQRTVAWGSPGSEAPPRRQPYTRGPQGGQCLSAPWRAPLSDIQQANILMSNDNPPRTCLADFVFMTVIPDASQCHAARN